MSKEDNTISNSFSSDRTILLLDELFKDNKFAILLTELKMQKINSVEELNNINLWKFMNQFGLYSIGQRIQIYHDVMDVHVLNKLKDNSDKYEFSIHINNSVYSGHTPSDVFLHFCEEMANRYPLKFRTLINAKNQSIGKIVISKNDIFTKSNKMNNPAAFIDSHLTFEDIIICVKWICGCCGDDNVVISYDNNVLEDKAVPKKNDENDFQDTAISSIDSNVNRIISIITDSDVYGISITDLSIKVNISKTEINRMIQDELSIIEIGNRLYNISAFSDWDYACERFERVVNKLIERNDGYISASQLYSFISTDLSMFLNDNDFDDQEKVYDIAKYLFEKLHYHGIKLQFYQNMHITKADSKPITTISDVLYQYAYDQGGFIKYNDLEDYMQHKGLRVTSCSRALSTNFLLYGDNQYLFINSIDNMPYFLQKINDKLSLLFEEFGDHVVFRHIPQWWYAQLPDLPSVKEWTPLLLQSIILKYSSESLNGVRTIPALETQSDSTLHAMITTKDSEIETFSDAIVSVLIDNNNEKREFRIDEFREMLKNMGLIAGRELYRNEARVTDERFIWDDEQHNVKIRM